MFAPPPPSVGGVPGGIAAITAILMRELAHRPDVHFGAPVPKESSGRLGVRRALASVSRLVTEARRIRRGGTVLFFASSQISFWEKLAWAFAVRTLGRRVAMVMVDGHFPGYWTALPAPARVLARALVRTLGVRIAAQSPGWQRYYEGIFPGARVERIAASVDREFFDAVHQPGAERARLRLLYVGWIVEAKGVVDLLDAARMLIDAGTTAFHLRLVGPVLREPERWAAEVSGRGLGGWVTLAGSVHDRAELVREYERADVFVFASHFEGFPVALLEAAAVGLPCIASRVGGIPDILRDGEAGLLVPARAPGELAAAIAVMVGDPVRREALGTALRAHARAEYTHERCAASYLSLLGLS